MTPSFLMRGPAVQFPYAFPTPPHCLAQRRLTPGGRCRRLAFRAAEQDQPGELQADSGRHDPGRSDADPWRAHGRLGVTIDNGKVRTKIPLACGHLGNADLVRQEGGGEDRREVEVSQAISSATNSTVLQRIPLTYNAFDAVLANA